MVSESEVAREGIGVTDEDTYEIRRASRRRRLVMTLAGGVGTIAAMIAGYLTALHLYSEPETGLPDSYPFVAPIVAISAARSRYRLGVVGICAAVVSAFVLMFILTAAAYNTTKPSVLYGVWNDGQ